MGWPGARFRPRPRRAVERRGALRGATAGQGICAIAGSREQRLIWPIGFSQRRLEPAAYQGDHARGRRNPQLCRRAFGPHWPLSLDWASRAPKPLPDNFVHCQVVHRGSLGGLA